MFKTGILANDKPFNVRRGGDPMTFSLTVVVPSQGKTSMWRSLKTMAICQTLQIVVFVTSSGHQSGSHAGIVL